MAKTNTELRQQIGVRLSSEAVSILAALQAFYTQRAGIPNQLSQSDTVELLLRDTAKALKLKVSK